MILYDYDPSRSHSVPMRLLEGFKGYLQTDAYEGYGPVCRDSQLISVGCMAHARRKFDEALKAQSAVDPNKTKSTLAATALKTIQSLYRIERKIKNLSSEEKKAIRQEQSAPILKELKSWLDTNVIVVPPKSTLGKANGHEPYAYLLTVFSKLPAAKTLEDIEALLPFNLKPGAGSAAFGRN